MRRNKKQALYILSCIKKKIFGENWITVYLTFHRVLKWFTVAGSMQKLVWLSYKWQATTTELQAWNNFNLGTRETTFSWSGCLSDSTEYWVLVIEKQHIGINATSQILNPSQEVVTFTTQLCGYSCQLPKLPWTVTEASHSRFSSWSCTRITAWKFFSEFDDMKQVLFPV